MFTNTFITTQTAISRSDFTLTVYVALYLVESRSKGNCCGCVINHMHSGIVTVSRGCFFFIFYMIWLNKNNIWKENVISEGSGQHKQSLKFQIQTS